MAIKTVGSLKRGTFDISKLEITDDDGIVEHTCFELWCEVCDAFLTGLTAQEVRDEIEHHEHQTVTEAEAAR